MPLKMVRASIRKEMALVFSGSITLLVNRHRFPLYAISLDVTYLRSSIFISIDLIVPFLDIGNKRFLLSRKILKFIFHNSPNTKLFGGKLRKE